MKAYFRMICKRHKTNSIVFISNNTHSKLWSKSKLKTDFTSISFEQPTFEELYGFILFIIMKDSYGKHIITNLRNIEQ